MTQAEIGELLSDQVYSFLNDLKAQRRAAIEPEVWDDEDAIGYQPLDRWGDARFNPKRSRWAYEAQTMTDWKA